MNSQINWKEQIKKLVAYSNNNGYQVIFKKDKKCISSICFEKSEITIQSSYTKEKQFYLLLHELGHYIFLSDTKKYKNGVGYVLEHFSVTSMASRTAEIEEEFEAWKAGYALSKELKLKIRRDSFERFKSKLLSTYFVWAVQAKIVGNLKNDNVREELLETKEMVIYQNGK
jgi:hypothetical protein